MNELPARPTCYHGQEVFIQTVADKIISGHRTGSPSRISIHGAPGLGKTTSAIGVLHHHTVKAFYEDHRYFVSCEASLTPTLLLSALATALGLKISGERDGLLPQIMSALRAIEFPILLVLDNFEACWNCDKRHEVQKVLDHLDSLRHVAFMVTMRSNCEPDGTFWTNIPRLRVLDSASARQVFKEVAGKTENLDLDMLDGLLRRVEYLPQAVVLLARLMRKGETLASLCRRWELEGTSVISPSIEDYHYNLNASFRLSISSHSMKNSPFALRLLSTLACLPNGIPRNNLERITYIPKSKVHHAAQTLNEIGLAEYDSDTLKVIAPIRQYVSQYHLPPSDDVLKTRHHYRSLICQVQKCKSWREARQILDKIEPELGNIYETLIRWISSSDQMEDVASAILDLSKFLFPTSDRTALLERIIGGQEDLISPAMRAALLHMHGMSLFSAEDYLPACYSLDRAHEIYYGLGDTVGASACFWAIGDIYRLQGRYQEALGLLQSALAGYRELGAPYGGSRAACLWSLADVHHVMGDSEAGLMLAKEASHLYQMANDRTGVISVTLLRASIEISRDNFDEARKLLDASSGECKPQIHPTNHKNHLLQMGKLFCRTGELQEARVCFSQALNLYNSNSRTSKQGRADAFRHLGTVALQAKDSVSAEKYLQDAQDIYKNLGNNLNIAEITSCFGHLYYLKGKNLSAESAFENARDLYSHIGCRREYAECLVSIAKIKAEQEHQAEAAELFQEAGDVYCELRNTSQAFACHQLVAILTEPKYGFIPEQAAPRAEKTQRTEEHLWASTTTMGW
jgi:tetratricopeptide (TPR) repeat protein